MNRQDHKEQQELTEEQRAALLGRARGLTARELRKRQAAGQFARATAVAGGAGAITLVAAGLVDAAQLHDIAETAKTLVPDGLEPDVLDSETRVSARPVYYR